MRKRRIIIFGYGKLANALTQFLDKDHYEVVIADKDEKALSNAQEDGFETLLVDYSHDSQLMTLGIGKNVDTIFCLLSSDAENVFLVISLRALEPRLRIVAVADAQESIPKFKAAGADRVIDPYEISGRKMWRLLKNPMIADVIEHTLFGTMDLHLAEITIKPDTPLENQFLKNLTLSESYNLIILGIVDKELGEDFIFVTRGVNHKLDAGDVLVVIGSSKDIARLREDTSTSSVA